MANKFDMNSTGNVKAPSANENLIMTSILRNKRDTDGILTRCFLQGQLVGFGKRRERLPLSEHLFELLLRLSLEADEFNAKPIAVFPADHS
ncbi:MAG: hypothetical protein ICV75_02965 [Nitrospiraceae bacterium]|nr:hypothetical protein [Nitrospiraceae bacterium]